MMPNYRRKEREAKRIAADLLARTSDELRERMRQSPEKRLLWMFFVTALEREGKTAEALVELGRVIEAGGCSVQMATHWRAGLLTKLGRYPEAISDFERLIAAGDDHPAHFYSLGNLHSRVGDVGAARSSWQAAARRNHGHNQRPSRWSARGWVAWLMLETLLNVRYYAQCRIVWSYVRPGTRNGFI